MYSTAGFIAQLQWPACTGLATTLPTNELISQGDEVAKRIAFLNDKGRNSAKGLGAIICCVMPLIMRRCYVCARKRIAKATIGRNGCDMDVASTYFHLSPAEKVCLASRQRPIVLLKNKVS